MAFDPTGRLAVSGFLDNTLVRFAPDGTFLGTFIAQVGATDEAPCPLPTDITYGREGDLVVGDFGICASDNGAEWFDRNGVFKALVVPGEADGVDLDADQCTLFVADANDDVIYNTNICTGQPASPRFGIATAVDSPSVRVLPDGSVLFVDAFAPDYAIVQPGRYSRGGTLLATYGTGGCSHWSGVVPDVGGTAFWSNCSTTHSSTLFDVATGAVLRTLPGVVVDAVYGGFRSALARRGNRPPDCTTAQATPSTLSPADHEYQTVAFSGAVDPDNNPVTLTVTGVTQDEPIAGTGPGDRDPDAKRSSGTLLLRRERSDSGDGRVYRVTLRGADGKGGSCTTTVAVSVPLTAGGTAVDSGGSYNSFGA
jgi:hypothetical protein